MNKQKPPKRRVLKKGIPLDDSENRRFVRDVETRGFTKKVETFISKTGLYLRGRHDGPLRTGAVPCGYVFISEDSFDKGHDALLFLDPRPQNTPLKASFRRWYGVLPFEAQEWNKLSVDRAQKNMKAMDLVTEDDLRFAMKLADAARVTFSQEFDLTVNLTR